MSKQSTVLASKYQMGTGGHLRLCAHQGTLTLQWDGRPGWNSGYSKDTWADTPTNRKKAYADFEKRAA